MQQIEEPAAEALALLDQFHVVVKRIVEEETPVGAKIERVRQLREGVLSEIEALLHTFDQAAQVKEKELIEQMARLRQLRDQVAVIWQGIVPMFTPLPRTE